MDIGNAGPDNDSPLFFFWRHSKMRSIDRLCFGRKPLEDSHKTAGDCHQGWVLVTLALK